MENSILYELPMFSSNLVKEPEIIIQDMDIKFEIEGFDDNNNKFKTYIKFSSVLCHKYTAARFTPKIYDAYDRIVELTNSEWLKELQEINQEDFSYWMPKHYVLYLDGIGMYQFIAQNFEVIEND